MLSLKLIVLLIGILCLFLAGVGVTHPRLRFEWLGLGFIAAGMFLPLQ